MESRALPSFSIRGIRRTTSELYVQNESGLSWQRAVRRLIYFHSDRSKSGFRLRSCAERRSNRSWHFVSSFLYLQHFPSSLLQTISAEKDVDGFHLYNVGGLVIGKTVFPPCTPYGVVKLLEHEGVELEGKNVVVVGASNIVGKPMALMLMQREATVCICHAKTRDLAQLQSLPTS